MSCKNAVNLFKIAVINTYLLSFGLVFLLSSANVSAQPPGIPEGWTDGYVYANGIRIHYYHAVPVKGKPVIVMAHGGSDNGLCWTTLTWKLQDSYDIYMVDARAHGLSDPFLSNDDANTMVKDLVEFVRVMEIDKPILMGHSMGAATVRRIGAEYPDLAKAIIMLDPALGNSGPFNSPGTGSLIDRIPAGMQRSPEEMVARNNQKFDDLVATCRRDNPKWDIVDCQYWALSKRQYHNAYTSEALQALWGGLITDGDSRQSSLKQVQVPALILKADASPEQREANEEAASVMQKGKLVHIDGAGHNLHHDELEQTVKVLKEFLSTLK